MRACEGLNPRREVVRELPEGVVGEGRHRFIIVACAIPPMLFPECMGRTPMLWEEGATQASPLQMSNVSD